MKPAPIIEVGTAKKIIGKSDAPDKMIFPKMVFGTMSPRNIRR